MAKRKTEERREKDQARYYGIDLHKDQLTWHCISKKRTGEIERTSGVTETSKIIEEFVPLIEEAPSYLVVEASSPTFFFYGLVESHCEKVYVVNPVAFRELYMTGKKTDRIDAKKLAERLKYHVEADDSESGFPEVYVPDAEILKVRKLVTTYELLVKQRTQIKNQAKAVFRAKLISVGADVLDKGLDEASKNERLDEADHAILTTLKSMYDALGTQKEELKKQVLLLGTFRFREELKLLMTIPGVSAMSATVFMADIWLPEEQITLYNS